VSAYRQSIPVWATDSVEWKEVDAIAIDDVWCAHVHPTFASSAVLTHRPTGLALDTFAATTPERLARVAAAPPVVSMRNVKVTTDGGTGRMSMKTRAALREWRNKVLEAL